MAAGLGFKTFTTGEVLTAADTNGYLMQGVLVFASAAARDAAITSPQEGQCCYLKDTDAVLTYSGAAWVGFDDSNAIQNSIVDAKGDLVAASGADTPARLAVGANGETLVANSAASSGLQYNANYAAGKNKIINGDFNIWQRGTSFAMSTGVTTFTADRMRSVMPTGATISRQTFTPGTAPVAGYEGQFYFNALITTNAQNYEHGQFIENARTFAGQTVTLSFWSRSTVGAQPISVAMFQNFGTGGSPSSQVTIAATTGTTPFTPTSSWVRYIYTFDVPSVSGKTFGTNNDSYLWVRFGQYTTTATNTSLDYWGIQLEAGSVATAFQTATGTFQGELAACQRYYQRTVAGTTYGGVASYGWAAGTTTSYASISLPVTMRVKPTSIDFSAIALLSYTRGAAFSLSSVTLETNSNAQNLVFQGTITGGTAGTFGSYTGDNNAAGYLGYSAEL